MGQPKDLTDAEMQVAFVYPEFGEGPRLNPGALPLFGGMSVADKHFCFAGTLETPPPKWRAFQVEVVKDEDVAQTQQLDHNAGGDNADETSGQMDPVELETQKNTTTKIKVSCVCCEGESSSHSIPEGCQEAYMQCL